MIFTIVRTERIWRFACAAFILPVSASIRWISLVRCEACLPMSPCHCDSVPSVFCAADLVSALQETSLSGCGRLRIARFRHCSRRTFLSQIPSPGLLGQGTGSMNLYGNWDRKDESGTTSGAPGSKQLTTSKGSAATVCTAMGADVWACI